MLECHATRSRNQQRAHPAILADLGWWRGLRYLTTVEDGGCTAFLAGQQWGWGSSTSSSVSTSTSTSSMGSAINKTTGDGADSDAGGLAGDGCSGDVVVGERTLERARWLAQIRRRQAMEDAGEDGACDDGSADAGGGGSGCKDGDAEAETEALA